MYDRYADDFAMLRQGTNVHAQEAHEACWAFLEGKPKPTVNLRKTHITHVSEHFAWRTSLRRLSPIFSRFHFALCAPSHSTNRDGRPQQSSQGETLRFGSHGDLHDHSR